MSKGLGAIQQSILAKLRDGEISISGLAYCVADDKPPTNAQLKSVYRAVHALESRGIVETHKRRLWVGGHRRGRTTYDEKWHMPSWYEKPRTDYRVECVFVKLVSVERLDTCPKYPKVANLPN